MKISANAKIDLREASFQGMQVGNSWRLRLNSLPFRGCWQHERRRQSTGLARLTAPCPARAPMLDSIAMRKNMEIPGRFVQDCPLPFDYAMRTARGGAPRQLFLLLHGYAETGQKILEKLGPALPEDAVVIAPNGPFPINEWVGTDWKERRVKFTFCWHFYEPKTDSYYIPPDTAIAHVCGGLKRLGLLDLPKTIIGFSQGGYLATYIAERLSNVRQVIAIGCEFLPDELKGSVPFRLDGIYGEKDHILSPTKARESHQAILGKTQGGDLFSVPGLGHEIDDRVASRVAELVGRV
jgi:predicted esterase